MRQDQRQGANRAADSRYRNSANCLQARKALTVPLATFGKQMAMSDDGY
jgi:hypothetical protein